MRTLLDKDWDLYLETRAEVALGSSQSEPAQRYAAFCRGCTTQDAARAALAAVHEFDVSELLPRVKAPTLLIHQRQNEMEYGQAASKMASKLPNARLVALDSEVTDFEPLVNVIDHFLWGRESADSSEEAGIAEQPSGGEWQHPIGRTPMVGRGEERAQLQRLLERAVGGQGSLAMISGEAGVGKTRLVQELAAEGAGLGVLALTGHCYESEEAPYVPFVEILQSGLRGTTQEAFREGLGKYAADVAKLMPELRRIFADIPAPLELPPEQERRYLFNSLSELLEQASRGQPLLLAVEDLHWADSSTLMLLQHIVRRLQGMRVLLICTYRDTEIDGSLPFKETLAEIVRRRLAERIALKRLPPPDVKAILDALGGQGAPEPVAQAVYSETEGNPFFVEEVFKHLAEEGKLFDVDGRWLDGLRLSEGDVPESIRLVLGRRLQRLSEQCRSLLVRAAIIGPDFNTELLQDLSGGDRNSLLEALEEAERSHLIAPLREPRGSFAFAHELVRQTILSDLSGSRRERLHLRVADAIEARYVTPKPDDRQTREQFASRLAYHYYQAANEADPRKTVDYLTIAGERGMTAAAFEDALRHFDEALAFLPPGNPSGRAALLFKRGLASRSLGRWDDALNDWREALGVYEELSQSEAAGRVAWSMTIQLLWGGRYLEALEISRRGLIALGEVENGDRALLLAASGLTIGFGGAYGAGSSMIGQAQEIAERLKDQRLLGRVLTFTAVHHLAYLQYPQAVSTGSKSAEILRTHNDLWFLADALWCVQDALLGLGELNELVRLADELEPLSAQLGHQGAILFSATNRGLYDLMTTGDIQRFQTFAAENLKLRRSLGSPWTSTAHIWMGLADLWSGDWERALDKLRHG
ncbi:MAG TPA: AAA family ATPase, partial [Dehalococcoidia bacterium]|nr:AAA family ATPase [Dehalococcoidia bacterium]